VGGKVCGQHAPRTTKRSGLTLPCTIWVSATAGLMKAPGRANAKRVSSP
jgi:hypothetical protein